MFPHFLKRTTNVMAPCLSVMFRRLVRLSSFPACWRQANVTQIPIGPPSSSVANYRPISITSVLSKVFDRLMSVRLGRFKERRGMLLTTKFAYRKGLGIPVMHFFVCPIHCKVHWRVGRRLGSFRLIWQQPLIELSIRAFFVSSALRVLEVMCCLYWYSFYQTVHSTLW